MSSTVSRCAPRGTAGQLAAGQSWGAGLPGSGADQNAVIGLLQTLDDYADALGDLSISEAVFQIMRGNFGRAGGADGRHLARRSARPTPDVVDTPRGGLDLTHRVALLFAGTPSAERRPGAAVTDASARRRRAVARRLARPRCCPIRRSVRCAVSYHDAGGDHARAGVACAISTSARSIASRWPMPPRCRSRPSWRTASCFAAALPPDATRRRRSTSAGRAAGGVDLFPDVLLPGQVAAER